MAGRGNEAAEAGCAGGPLAVDYRPVEAHIPHARNARTHSDGQVARIAGSIREYGFTNPVLVDGEMGIIAGHGRVMAARKLGLATVPVIELAHLTEAQKRAYVLAAKPSEFRILFQSPDGSVHDQDGNPVPDDQSDSAMRRGIM